MYIAVIVCAVVLVASILMIIIAVRKRPHTGLEEIEIKVLGIIQVKIRLANISKWLTSESDSQKPE